MRVLILSIVVLTSFCFGQEIVFVNQKQENLNHLEVKISLPKKYYDQYNFSGQNYTKIVDTMNNQFSIHVKSTGCIKEYYNEYTKKQFSEIDTIILYENCLMKDYTPRILFDDFSSWKNDTLYYQWFGDYLKEIDFGASNSVIEISIFSNYKNILSKQESILEYKGCLANIFGVSEDKIRFKFTTKPYITRDTDLFFPGQKVDKEFINQQNTKSMKNYAKSFSIVGEISIISEN